jgi:hypothetical protein
MALQMMFYWWKEGGKVVVQNMIMGYVGQKHEHTPEEFEKWRADVPGKNLVHLNKCDKR